MKKHTNAGLVAAIGLTVAIPAGAQVKAERSGRSVEVGRVEAIELGELSPDRFDRLPDGQRIVHRDRETTAGELRRQADRKTEIIAVTTKRSREAAQLRFEARQLEFLNEQEGMAEVQIAAAEQALAEMRRRNQIIRRTR
jgi:hypothetical protein